MQAGLAQLVERAIRNRKVIGSTPIAGSIADQSFTAVSVGGCLAFLFVTASDRLRSQVATPAIYHFRIWIYHLSGG